MALRQLQTEIALEKFTTLIVTLGSLLVLAQPRAVRGSNLTAT